MEIPTRDAIEARYPRLIRAMRWTALLARDEAVSVIWDVKAGLRDLGGGEAVQHYGGIAHVLAMSTRREARACARRFLSL